MCMAWKSVSSGRADWLRDTNAMLVSACCHFAMLIGVALVSIAGSSGGGQSQLVVSLGKGGDSGISPVADNSPLEGDEKAVDRSPLPAESQIEAALGPASAMDAAPLFSIASLATNAEIDVGPLVLPASPTAKSGSIGGL